MLATKANRVGNKQKSKMYERKSTKLLREYDKLDKKTRILIGDFLKNKWSAIHDSSYTEHGRKYVESLMGLNIDMDKVDKYETKYSKYPRYTKGYAIESEHIHSLIEKHK